MKSFSISATEDRYIQQHNMALLYNHVKLNIFRLNSWDMIRHKYPIEYDLSPETLEKGTQWLILRLKNVGDDNLHNLDIKMHSTDSLQISFRNPSGYIHRLTPNEEQYLNFQVDVHGTTALYTSIRYFKEGGSFHWDSPWIREQVHGDVAELESILVSYPYGTIGRELEIEAIVKGLGNSDGLDLEFWANTPSGKRFRGENYLQDKDKSKEYEQQVKKRLMNKAKRSINLIRYCFA